MGNQNRKPEVVFVLGGPGAGKGTQCAKIKENYGYHHLSAGDCLREERAKKGSMYGELIESHITQGSIVPVKITLTLLLKKMLDCGWWNQKFLIDGFPRNEDNLKGWISTMQCGPLQSIIKELKDGAEGSPAEDEVFLAKRKSLCDDINTELRNASSDDDGVVVKFCLFFDCSEESMTKRILERAKESGRSDDNIESLIKRFRTYEKETMPIINYYREHNKLETIKAESSIEEVFQNVQKIQW